MSSFGTSPNSQPQRLPAIGSSRVSYAQPSSSSSTTGNSPPDSQSSNKRGTSTTASNSTNSPPTASNSNSNAQTLHGVNATSNSSDLSHAQQQQQQSVEGVEVALLELLALVPLSAESIWEGDPELFPVLFQFKDSFQRLCGRPTIDETTAATSNVLAFNLPLQDFPVARKRFRVNRGLPTSALVALLCSKLGVADPSRFALHSLKGFRLNPDEPLLSYGFGTLFKSWELNVCRVRDRSKTTLLLPPVSSSVVESETLVMIFPPLMELVGLSKKTTRLSREELNIPISEIIRHAWQKLGVQNPERFTLMTPLDDHGEAIVLSSDQSLRAYGLGWRFHGPWELRVVFNSLAKSAETSRIPMRVFPWIDIMRASPSQEEAIEACRSLDSKLLSSEQEKKELRERELKAITHVQELENQSKTVTDREQAVSEYQQKLSSLSEALHVMEERLVSAESELKDMGEPRKELNEANEKINELNLKLQESQMANSAAENSLRQLMREIEVEKKKNERAEAEILKQREITQKEIVRQEAVLAYACRLKRELESAKSKQSPLQFALPGDSERKPIESDAVDTQLYNLTRANNELINQNRVLQEENDRLKVLLAASAPHLTTQTQPPIQQPQIPQQTTQNQQQQTQQISISRRISAPVPFQFARELSQIRERIQVTTQFAREHLLQQPAATTEIPKNQPIQSETQPNSVASSPPQEGRPISIPTSATERLQLLLKINNQKERMLKAASNLQTTNARHPSTTSLISTANSNTPNATFSPSPSSSTGTNTNVTSQSTENVVTNPFTPPTRDSIAITASSMYATLVRKFSEFPDGGLEDLRQ